MPLVVKNTLKFGIINTLTYKLVTVAKIFPKSYVGRNGKRNQQTLHIQVCDSSRHNGIKGAKAKCAPLSNLSAHI